MRKLRVFSAAITVEAFTVRTLMRLTGLPDKSVRYWIQHLAALDRIEPAGAARAAPKGRSQIQYRWTKRGREATRAEVRDMLPQASPEPSLGSNLEVFEDPFDGSLRLAEQCADTAELSRDEARVRQSLAMAKAEVEMLRRLLHSRSADDVQRCETVTRRLELLSSRPPIEALRAKITLIFREAFRRAAQYVSVAVTADESELLLTQEFALVINGTRESRGAREVERTAGQMGRTCIVLEMAGVSRHKRLRALQALGPVFTGPGSTAVKVFIILNGGGRGNSYRILDDVVSQYGDLANYETLMAGGVRQAANRSDLWASDIRAMILATTYVPSNDWLPRGIAKQALLHDCWGSSTRPSGSEIAKLTLNDPVIVDVANESVRDRRRWPQLSYHIARNEAVVRGLVIGSFPRATMQSDCEPDEQVFVFDAAAEEQEGSSHSH